MLLAGNPNVGKSVLFGALTKRYVVVSNYPGTTVEVARGTMELDRAPAEVLDLPGVNGLVPASEDERVTRDALLADEEGTVLVVADAKNLRRGLCLAVAIAETGRPLVLALNMMDEAAARGVRVDVPGLSRALGVPAVPTVATRGKGTTRLRATLATRAAVSGIRVDYPAPVEAAVAELAPLLAGRRWAARALALALLGGDEGIREWAARELDSGTRERIEILRRRLDAGLRNPVAYEIGKARLDKASDLLAAVYSVDPALSGAFERLARFGETVAGRGTAHVAGFLGAGLLLLSLGGFPFHPVAAGIAAVLIAAAIPFARRTGGSGFTLLAVAGGVYLTGVLARPLSDLLPEEGFLRSGLLQGFAAALLVSGVVLARQTTNLVWGTVSAMAVLYLLYLIVGVFGAGTLVDVMQDGFFAGVVEPALVRAAEFAFPGPRGAVAAFVHDLLVGEFGALTMALSYAIGLILPVVASFFLVFGILEDSGYLPRLAVMMNRAFSAMGLNGKAVLPMVLGLGCDTMATLTTRVLETNKERVIVTLLLALGVPCSAQLGVILGITSQIGATAILWWVGTILVVLFAVGWLSARLLPGRRSDFILELPPLRVPRVRNIAKKTLARIEWYLKEAVPLFFLGTLILFLLDRSGTLESLKWAGAPVVKGLLHLPVDVTPAFLIGFLRRDYGAAGLSDAWRAGLLSPRQAVVALVTITLFIPCIANFFIMIKERGLRTGLLMTAFILPMAFVVGGLVNFLMGLLGVLS
ncbi:MAG: ferrous iron transporter B [Planctomycetes bacterium]|nr:ferrous iron transporter B [Planctomycetota bacterium]